ncbi:MAG: phosphoribosylglycinamide formyltransferase [Proteobacteria bacterium]|nr:phosphoribosylglycinamide formyltransferase [Pseudomonadota bacterium]
MRKCRVGVLISGSGTNLQALIDACATPDFPAEIVVVVANKPDAKGLERARAVGIPTQVIEHGPYKRREDFDQAMHVVLGHHLVDMVCLAGFMRLLSTWFVEQWKDRLLNIHPSLLPAFKGTHVHEAVIAAGAKFSGCTVHFVRPEMDVGPIIVQAAVPVLADDTPQALAARVLAQEHVCYPLALRWFAEGRLTIEQERVRVQGAGESPQALVNPA